MINLKYFLADPSEHKSIVHQLYFIESFLQANVKHRLFVELCSRYEEYFPEYDSYFGRPLIMKKSIYGMTNSGNIFSGELTNWLIYE